MDNITQGNRHPLVYIPFTSDRLVHPFMKYDYSKILPWKSEYFLSRHVWGLGSTFNSMFNIVYLTHTLLFHVDWNSYSWDMAI